MPKTRARTMVIGLGPASPSFAARRAGGDDGDTTDHRRRPTTMAPTTAAMNDGAGATLDGASPSALAAPPCRPTGPAASPAWRRIPAATAASNNPVLSTLVSAVGAAELVDTLNGPGPFTIFAPANDAFAKIDKATLERLLADPKGDLTNILTYHVVAGEELDADRAGGGRHGQDGRRAATSR